MTDTPPILEDDYELFYERQFGRLMDIAVHDGMLECDAETLAHDVLLANICHISIPDIDARLAGAMRTAMRHVR
jgi:hypothetical protein